MSWGSSASGAWLFLTFTCIKNIICEFSELSLTFVVTSSHNWCMQNTVSHALVEFLPTQPLILAVKQCLSFAWASCAVSVSMSW